MHWCNDCRQHHDNFKIVKTEKGKTGKYHPYRDTMEAEYYTYTEVTLKCLSCGKVIKTEKDKDYEMSKSSMQKYGYRGSNYGT